MGFERQELLGLDREDIGILHKRAEKVMAVSRIRETDFLEPYGRETIERDLGTVKRKEETFEAETSEYLIELKHLADIFEAIVLESGERNNWFGETALLYKTSKYDDYENKVDAIIEFPEERPGASSFLGLAADVTFSSDTTDKFDALKKRIKKGQLPEVKYFHSATAHFHGRLGFIPEVIIGASKRTVLELAELWARHDNKELARHRIQIMILSQMEEQMEAFARYAELNGQDRVAEIYRDRLIIIREILESKRGLAKEASQALVYDEVNEGIMSFLNHWRRQMEAGAEA